MYTRRSWFLAALGGSATLLMTQKLAGSAAKKPEIRVFKRHFSRCCDSWMAHLKDNGFSVIEAPVKDLGAVKADYEIPPELRACHTAVVSGYIVEGHVPADLIHKLLNERRLVAGIAVAGDPAGAPGNERAGEKQPYRVVLFERSGKITTYAQR
ncbi:MAG TPA: DUF411 domain-containing protein [Longimicrobiales bacterium]|nr:DUF411 domain-containing protein [Longimicrobiales bacterium]